MLQLGEADWGEEAVAVNARHRACLADAAAAGFARFDRGDTGGATDNNSIITDILKLRAERARLLGYDNYAQWRLENLMAKTPEGALELMEAVWPAALSRVAEEVADMQAIADAEGAGIKIEPWDYRYYAEKVRQAKYDLDSDEVKQYLQLDKLREAIASLGQSNLPQLRAEQGPFSLPAPAQLQISPRR